MSQKLSADTYTLRPTILRLTLFGTLGLAAIAFGNTGCADKAIGRPCDVFTGDAGLPLPSAVYNNQALECPTRICIKPAAALGVSTDTTSLCSASCSQDSDCDGQARGPNDLGCKTGFACAIPFVTGPICCQKLCVCKDFYVGNNITTPNACLGSEAAKCFVQP
jgi:hypothetical protein